MNIIKPNLLIVEDSPTFQRLLIAHLERFHPYVEFDINIFSHGEAAKQFIENTQLEIDVIIADVMVPGSISGIDLLRFVRKHQEFHNIPFVIITANTDKTVKYEAHDLNCSGFLYKPFTMHQLHEMLRQWLKIDES